ncbi:MAG TPA: YceI family protein [Sphingobacteriaceae bacterium]|nr:YceI family protein [Sphingobacteriaceae bacterium]
MKRLLIAFALSAAISACNNNPDGTRAKVSEAADSSAVATGNSLKVSTQDSKLEWHGKKVTGAHHGIVNISDGTIYVNGGKLSGGSFKMDMTSITNNDLQDKEYKNKLETHLKSAEFFDVAKYPDANLEITNVKDLGNHKAEISANLTIKSVTKNILFTADIAEATDTTFKGSADFNINRQDWGVAYKGMQDDLISDEVNFKINLVAAK